MTSVLHISATVLNFAGAAFAAIYIWMNTFSKLTDVDMRNASTLKLAKSSMILSMVFALLACLFSKNIEVAEAIARATGFYRMSAITWFAVFGLCGFAMIYAVLSKSTFRRTLTETLKKMFSLSLWGGIIAILLSWLFS